MIRKALLTATALAIATAAPPALAGQVTVSLTDVQADAGDLYISLQSEAQFMQADAVASEIVDNPQDATVTVTFDDVPDGRYALMVWHDIDGDGTFSMGRMGPTDGWSMIGAAALRGMPSWEAQSFTLDGSATITEPMLYARDGQ
ncbi:DUF2141 domain-containing protein [Citromicrobium bathyomarinum]|uniref:DUF2141 domain-containing protein n=1 Tax=Citromicrobium bathyomarinum TaxID=72174 RepID=UPI00315A43EF